MAKLHSGSPRKTQLPDEEIRRLLAHRERRAHSIDRHVLGHDAQVRHLQPPHPVHAQPRIHHPHGCRRRHLARPEPVPARRHVVPEPPLDDRLVRGLVRDLGLGPGGTDLLAGGGEGGDGAGREGGDPGRQLAPLAPHAPRHLALLLVAPDVRPEVELGLVAQVASPEVQGGVGRAAGDVLFRGVSPRRERRTRGAGRNGSGFCWEGGGKELTTWPRE